MLLIVTVSVSAADNQSSVELQRVADNIKCDTDFYSGLVNFMSTLNSSTDLSQAITKINSDLTQIQGYANSGDRASLKTFIQSTYSSDEIALKASILQWRKIVVKDLTKGQKASVLSSFNQLRSTDLSCRLDTTKSLGNGRINYFNNMIRVYQDKINSISAKGFDTTALTQLITDSQTQIITPLQTAISSATTAVAINQAVKQYCLFDGCANGINFHLAAKFNLGKLQIVYNKISSNSNVSQTELTQLQTDITTTNSILTQVGTAQYTSQQSTQLWNSINDGYKVIQSLINRNLVVKSSGNQSA